MLSFRIDHFQRIEREDGYVWQLSIKGLQRADAYFTAVTGSNGWGLYDFNAGNGLLVILPPSRFCAHSGSSADQIVQRVAAALGAIGWGPEFHADQDSISGAQATKLQTRSVRNGTPSRSGGPLVS